MKILHVISNLETGGAQKLIGEFLPILNKNEDLEISLVIFESSESHIEKSLKSNGIRVISLNVGTHSPKAIGMLKKHMRKADIVHAHLFPTNYFVALANIGINKPLVFTEHSTHNRRRDYKWLRPVEKYFYNRYKKVACISPATKTALDKWLGYKRQNNSTVIIENGVDLERFRNQSYKGAKELFGREGIPVIMVSRFTDSKDHPTLLRAIKHIKNTEVFAVLVGDGERRVEIEKLTRELGIENRIVFLGTRSDIPELIKASKIGVQSSNWEGFGLTAVEIMASGIPVIASDVDGLKQVVGQGGLLFEKGNHIQLANLITMLAEDPDSYKTYAEKSLNRSQCFSIHTSADSYYNLYKSISGFSNKSK